MSFRRCHLKRKIVQEISVRNRILTIFHTPHCVLLSKVFDLFISFLFSPFSSDWPTIAQNIFPSWLSPPPPTSLILKYKLSVHREMSVLCVHLTIVCVSKAVVGQHTSGFFFPSSLPFFFLLVIAIPYLFSRLVLKYRSFLGSPTRRFSFDRFLFAYETRIIMKLPFKKISKKTKRTYYVLRTHRVHNC